MTTLQQLGAAWAEAKAIEGEANARRKEIEAQITALPDHTDFFQKDCSGTRRLEDAGLKASRSEKREWDQAGLTEIAPSIPNNQWPFRLEWKEDRKISATIAAHHPELWARLLPLLSVSYSAPSFSVAEAKK